MDRQWVKHNNKATAKASRDMNINTFIVVFIVIAPHVAKSSNAAHLLCLVHSCTEGPKAKSLVG